MESAAQEASDADANIKGGAVPEQPQAAAGVVASPHRISFVSASKNPEDEDSVLQSMCKLLSSLLRVPATGTPSTPLRLGGQLSTGLIDGSEKRTMAVKHWYICCGRRGNAESGKAAVLWRAAPG